MALKLTARQSEVLNFVRQSITRTGRPPTRAEIAKALGFRSANAAEDHLRALQRKGHLRLSSGTSRGIQLIPARTVDSENMSSVAPPTPADPTAKYAAANARGGAGPSLVRAGIRQAHRLMDSSSALLEDSLSLPLIGQVAAGHPILAAEHVEREISVAGHLFSTTPDYLLRVRGTSMRDIGILDGDLLAVRSTPEALNGQIVVARLGDDVTVKRLDRRGGHIRLLPENADFEPIIVSPGDDFTIEGIAVGLIRNGGLH